MLQALLLDSALCKCREYQEGKLQHGWVSEYVPSCYRQQQQQQQDFLTFQDKNLHGVALDKGICKHLSRDISHEGTPSSSLTHDVV